MPPPNIRPTPRPPDAGHVAAPPVPSAVLGATAVPGLPHLPSTSTRQGSAENSTTDAAFTALVRTVTLVFGCVELGGVRPVAVIE